MTRFRIKYMWFWCIKDSSMLIVEVRRSYNNPWHVTVRIGNAETIKLDCLGQIQDFCVFESHKCTGSSWQQFITRYFSVKSYTKCQELYVYVTPDFKLG